MSYELRGLGSRMARCAPASRLLHDVPTTYATVDGYALNSASDGLGRLNLRRMVKPPKRVRRVLRTIKRNVTLKRALVAGAVVAGAVVSGPAAARLAMGAGRLAARGGRAAFRGASSLLHRKPGSTPPFVPDSAPQPSSPEPEVESYGPQSAMQASAMRAAASNATALDAADERDPGPMTVATQNAEPVEVSADAPTKPTAPAKPSAAPLAIGGGLLWLLSRL